MKTKNIIIALIIIFAVLTITAFIYFQTSKKEKQFKELTVESILNEGKTITKMDLNINPEIVRWNTEKEETTLSGKGFFYVDLFHAQKVTDIFNDLNTFLKKKNFVNDEYNQDINENGKILKKYIKNGIVCNLSLTDNPNDTSTVKMACAEKNNLIYSFNSEKGKECNEDSDCEIFLDACAKAMVCRNKNYKFYNDCENPSSLIKDIDFSVGKCQCVENQCLPKKKQNGK